MTLVPLAVYFNSRGRAKVELALAKGKNDADKRATTKGPRMETRPGPDHAGIPVSGTGGGLLGWMQNHVPSRDQLEHNRWVRPFAHHLLRPELWRLTRRSVPRGGRAGAVCRGDDSAGAFHRGRVYRDPDPGQYSRRDAGDVHRFPGHLCRAAGGGGEDRRLVAAHRRGHRQRTGRAGHRPVGATTACWRMASTWACIGCIGRPARAPVSCSGCSSLPRALSLVGYLGSSLFWRWWIARKWGRRAGSPAAQSAD